MLMIDDMLECFAERPCPPLSIPHSNITNTSGVYNDGIPYKCDRGFQTTQADTQSHTQCLSDGTWQPSNCLSITVQLITCISSNSNS